MTVFIVAYTIIVEKDIVNNKCKKSVILNYA